MQNASNKCVVYANSEGYVFCAGLPEPSMSYNVISTKLSCAGSIVSGVFSFCMNTHLLLWTCVRTCVYVHWETTRTRGHFTFTPSVLADLMLRRFDKNQIE